MQQEKVDFLVAVGEKLCNLDSTPEMQKLEGLTDASVSAKTEPNHAWDDGDQNFVDIVATMVGLQRRICPSHEPFEPVAVPPGQVEDQVACASLLIASHLNTKRVALQI